MLSLLYSGTLYAWLAAVLMNLPLLLNKNTQLFNLQRLVNLVLAALTCLTGFVGLLSQKTLTVSIPELFFIFKPSLSLNPISSFFVFLTGVSYLGVCFFSSDYFRHFTRSHQKKNHFFETIFVFFMLLVFTANDPFTFLFSWELMAFLSYFLVVGFESNKKIRKAGFLYLGIAHISFFAIAISLYLLSSQGPISDFPSFDKIASSVRLSQPVANAAFVFAFLGFGAKAGVFPLHVWLPEAHPAAPSPISALMSGIMLKTAIYGLIRWTFDFLLPYQQIWWGSLLVGLGLITLFIGVIHAAMQTDMKRLLAYSSVENIGFIVVALGLAMMFYQYRLYTLSTLALLVVFLHSLNHSLFKSLLFLGTGSILHATGERNLGKLGGLIHPMPWVAACVLIGTLAMAGLPFFNGFISEWLYLSIFFYAHPVSFDIAIFSPLIIALSVLAFGLSGFVIVKFYGITFLGQPRESELARAHPSTWLERAGLLWLAFWCLLLGVWPNAFIQLIQQTVHQLSLTLSPAVSAHAFFLPVSHSEPLSHGFSPLFLGISFLVLLIIVFLLFRYLSPHPIRRATSWDCGFSEITSRMQDTAEGFGQPFKQIFSKLITVKLTLPKANDLNPYYHSQLTEKIWAWFYYPLANLFLRIAALTKWVQQGRITSYLLYLGLTLLILLIWVVWT